MSFQWPVDRSVFPALPAEAADDYAVKLAEQRAAAQLAVTVLWALSGRQFGLAEHTVRPCRLPYRHRQYGSNAPYLLAWDTDRWSSWPCGCSGGRCEIGGPRAAHLPGPVNEVVEVRIAGAVLDDEAYTVEGDVVYRTALPWPQQDLGKPLGETNTWSVTYLRGLPVPEEAAALTGLLAKEFLDAFTDEGRCRLPRTVGVASRNGVSYKVYDPAVIYANGKTGLPEIDIWLAAINPHALAAAPSVI